MSLGGNANLAQLTEYMMRPPVRTRSWRCRRIAGRGPSLFSRATTTPNLNSDAVVGEVVGPVLEGGVHGFADEAAELFAGAVEGHALGTGGLGGVLLA